MSNMAFPPGYRFVPTDEELVYCYLREKINNQPLSAYKVFIPEDDVFRNNPQELTARWAPIGDIKIWYFFTRRHRREANGKRPNRCVSDGYWKATDVKTIKLNGVAIGVKKGLEFRTGTSKNKGVKTSWLMKEYEVKDMNVEDWVLCKIYQKEKKENNSSSSSSSSRGEVLDQVLTESTSTSSLDHMLPTDEEWLEIERAIYDSDTLRELLND